MTVGDQREPRLATVDDAAEVGRLLHDFNAEFDTPSPGADVLAGRLRVLLAGPRPSPSSPATPAVAVAAGDAATERLVRRPGRPARRALRGARPARPGHRLGDRSSCAEGAPCRGVELIEINVDEGDVDAQRFYERHGFSATEPATGERAFYYARELGRRSLTALSRFSGARIAADLHAFAVEIEFLGVGQVAMAPWSPASAGRPRAALSRAIAWPSRPLGESQ